MRLTVHVVKAPFKEVERKDHKKFEYDKDGNKMDGKWTWVVKPINSKCIVNTFSFKGLKNEKDISDKLSQVRSKYTIAQFKDKQQKTYQNGKEMIYVSFCNR